MLINRACCGQTEEELAHVVLGRPASEGSRAMYMDVHGIVHHSVFQPLHKHMWRMMSQSYNAKSLYRQQLSLSVQTT